MSRPLWEQHLKKFLDEVMNLPGTWHDKRQTIVDGIEDVATETYLEEFLSWFDGTLEGE